MSDCATAPEVSTSLSQPDAEVEDVEMRHIEIQAAPLDMLGALLTPERSDRLMSGMARGRTMMAGRVLWNVNATAHGGGVAEMLQALLAYARGAGVDARFGGARR